MIPLSNAGGKSQHRLQMCLCRSEEVQFVLHVVCFSNVAI